MNLTSILVRIGFAVSLLSSAASHAYLYVHGYRHIPMIGTAFLIQASVSFAMAALILLGGPWWLRWTAAAQPAALWSPSLCPEPPGSSASPSMAGIPRHTRRSAWEPKC